MTAPAVELPTRTRAAVLHRGAEVRIEDVPLPAPPPGEMVIRILACGLCPGEAMTWYMDRKAPLGLGHEPVGRVVFAGARVSRFAVGDRVFVHHHAPCHRCRACRRGDHVHCAAWRASRLTPGGVSEFALVPEGIVAGDALAIPESVSDEAATFIEPLACVIKSVRRGGVRAGDRVLVIGLGVMGLLHLLAARRLGAELVIGADRVPARLARARALGADLIVDAAADDLAARVAAHTGGDGADVVIVGPGTAEAIELGFRATAAGGTLVLFTPTAPEVRWPLPVHDAFFREVRVVPTYSAGPPETAEALRWLAGGFPAEELITHRFALADAAAGYRLVREAAEALKVVIRP